MTCSLTSSPTLTQCEWPTHTCWTLAVFNCEHGGHAQRPKGAARCKKAVYCYCAFVPPSPHSCDGSWPAGGAAMLQCTRRVGCLPT